MRDRVRKALRTLALSFDPLIIPRFVTIAQISPISDFSNGHVFSYRKSRKTSGCVSHFVITSITSFAMHSDVRIFFQTEASLRCAQHSQFCCAWYVPPDFLKSDIC